MQTSNTEQNAQVIPAYKSPGRPAGCMRLESTSSETIARGGVGDSVHQDFLSIRHTGIRRCAGFQRSRPMNSDDKYARVVFEAAISAVARLKSDGRRPGRCLGTGTGVVSGPPAAWLNVVRLFGVCARPG